MAITTGPTQFGSTMTYDHDAAKAAMATAPGKPGFKGVTLEEADTYYGGHMTPEYMKNNPAGGQVPFHNGRWIPDTPAAAPTPAAAAPAAAAAPPVPGGGGAMGAISVSGASGQGSRANMPSADFAAAPTPIDMGGGSSADASGFRQGSPGALNPRLGNAPPRNSMSALASMGKAY